MSAPQTSPSLSDATGPMKLFHDHTRGPELRALYREIWRLAWPAFMGQGLHSIVAFVSRIIVSRLGEKSYNSVNVGFMIFFMIITVIAAVGVGTTALVAQSWGSGDRKRAGHILQQSLLFGALLAAVIALLGMPISRLTYHLMGADAQTAREGMHFLVWLFLGLPFMALGFIFAAALRGAGDTKTPMVVGLIMGVISLALGYTLILGNLGFPRLGTVGAALSINGAFGAFTLILAGLFFLNKTVLRLPLRGWRFDLRTGFLILKIGIPSAMEWVLIQLGLLIYVFVIYRYGDEAAAGYFTGITILTIAQTPAFGFQAAAVTLVGQAVGGRRWSKAESAFRHCILLGFLFMSAVGVVTFFLATPAFLHFAFGKLSARSLEFARTYTMLTALVMPLMGIAFTVAGGLRGAGDTVPPLIASTVGVYGGRIVAAYGLYALFHPPVAVVWCSMFPDLLLRVGIMAHRLRSGKWKRVKL